MCREGKCIIKLIEFISTVKNKGGDSAHFSWSIYFGKCVIKNYPSL